MKKFNRSLLALAALSLCSAAQAQHYELRSVYQALSVVSPVYSVALTANSLDFGGVNVGQVGTQSIGVLNSGNQPVSVGAITVSNPAFNATTSCGNSLPPGAQCPVQVSFTPTAGQAYSGAVTINANNSPLALTLAGTGLQALAALTANSSSNFGQLYVGQSASRTFTLTNNGNAAATNVAATLTGPASLALTSNTCGISSAPATVQAGGSCTMTVTYTPTVAETLSNASLGIVANAVGSPTSQAITGSAVVQSDPYWTNVTYLMHMDGANNSTVFTEAKGNSVVRYGNPTITTAASKFGGASAQFSTGTTSALSLPPFSPSGSFTIEAWVYIGSSTPASSLIDVGGIANMNWQPQAIYYGWPTAGQLNWLASSANTGTDISGNNGIAFGAPVLNAWNHFAVVRDVSVQQYRFYLNGTLTYTLNSSKTPFTSAYRVYLGNYPNPNASSFAGASFAGYMDEVRFTNGVARYSGSSYSVPTLAFPQQ